MHSTRNHNRDLRRRPTIQLARSLWVWIMAGKKNKNEPKILQHWLLIVNMSKTIHFHSLLTARRVERKQLKNSPDEAHVDRHSSFSSNVSPSRSPPPPPPPPLTHRFNCLSIQIQQFLIKHYEKHALDCDVEQIAVVITNCHLIHFAPQNNLPNLWCDEWEFEIW